MKGLLFCDKKFKKEVLTPLQLTFKPSTFGNGNLNLELFPFFDRMPDGKLVAYQKKKNMISIDGKPSDMAGRCED